MTKPIRILLVEDNPGDRDLIQDAFETSETAFDISVAIDGADAIEYLLKRGTHLDAETPDLIVLDLNMPKMDGRQVLTEIKKHDSVKSVPVVVFTSSDAEADVAQSYALGANCYVTKPVDLVAFQAVVKSIEEFWFTVAKLP